MGARTCVAASFMFLLACAGRAAPPGASHAEPAPASAVTPAAGPRQLATLAVGPGVAIAVHAGQLPDGRWCWTWTTQGLAAQGKAELVLSVKLRDGDEVERHLGAPAELLTSLALGGGEAPAPWSWHELPPGTLGRDDLMGFAVVPAAGPAGVALAPGALTLLLLTAGELATARQLGVPRLAAVLAHRHGHYPTAWWFDRDLPPALLPEQVRHSMWSVNALEPLPGVTAFLDVEGDPVLLATGQRAIGRNSFAFEGIWRVRVTPAAAPALIAYLHHLSARRPSGIIVAPDELSGARFAWVDDASDPHVVRGDAVTRPAVALLGFYPDRSMRGGQLIEDGVAIMLSWDQRDAMVTALSTGQDVTIEPSTAGLMPWRLEWNR